MSLLADPASRVALHVRLSPTDLPADLPRTGPTGAVDPLIGGFNSVDEWRDQLFDKNGQLVVPDPNVDGVAWRAFLAWAYHVNPDLAAAVDQMHTTMMKGFNTQVRRSQS